MDAGDDSVFELEMGDGTAPAWTHVDPEAARQKLLRLCAPKGAFAMQVASDFDASRRVSPAGVEDLADSLSAAGHRVTIRRTGGGHAGDANQVFQNLRHSHLIVTDSRGEASLIVEPAFREQFAIGSPTPEYEALLGLVPEGFVGVAEDLLGALDLVCAAMRVAFRATGRPVPPWRRRNSIASKWLSKTYEAEEFNAGGATPEGPGMADASALDRRKSPRPRIQEERPRIIVVGPK